MLTQQAGQVMLRLHRTLLQREPDPSHLRNHRETWQATKPANDLVLLDRQSHVGCMYNAHLSGMLWLVCVLLLIL